MIRNLYKQVVVFICLMASVLVYSLPGYSQQVFVSDNASLRPVENVSIFNINHEKTALTNNHGKALLVEFNFNDTLIFQHTSYNTFVISYENLKEASFQVKLASRSVKLTEVVISASKWEQKKEEVPNRIVSISAKQIAFNNPQTSADLLGNTHEVFIQKSQQGGGSPMIRGFAANSLLIMIDGVRMNNAIYRGGNLQNVILLDANIIENAEVIFGPGSVMYGSDALGGVMDFHTKRPDLAFDGNNFVSVSLLTRYASASNERTGHIDINFGTRKWGFLTSFSTSYFDDLKMGNSGHEDYTRREYASRIDSTDVIVQNEHPNIQRFSGYDQFNFMQKVRFRPSEDLDLEYAFHYSGSSDIPRYDRLIQYDDNTGLLKYADWHYGPQEWMMHSLTTRLMKPNTIYDDTRIILAYQDLGESRHSRKFNNSRYLNQEERVRVLSLNADFNKQVKEQNFFFYGIEAVYNIVSSTANKQDIYSGVLSPAASRYPDGKNNYTTLAAYLNYKRNFNEKTTLLAGFRYTYVSLFSTIDDTAVFNYAFRELKLNTSAINGSLGVTWRPSPGWQLNVSLASGFRAPNLDDIAKVFDPEPGTVVVPNPDLKPEYSYNADVELIKRFGEDAVLDVSLFYTLLRDAIVRRDFTFNGQDSIFYNGELSKVKAMVNASRAYIYGVNISFKWDLSRMFAVATYLNYTMGEDNEGNALRHVAPLFGSTNLIFRYERFRAELYAVYNGSIPYEKLAPTERSKNYMYAKDENGNPYSPEWWTLNLRTSYKLFKEFTIDLGIENILNYRYRPYSSGIVSPGRNLMVALRVNF